MVEANHVTWILGSDWPPDAGPRVLNCVLSLVGCLWYWLLIGSESGLHPALRSTLLENIQSSCSLRTCSLCSDWLLWASLKACYWSVVRWCQDDESEVWRRRTVSRWLGPATGRRHFHSRSRSLKREEKSQCGDILRERVSSSEQTAEKSSKTDWRLTSCPHLSSKWKLSCCQDVTGGKWTAPQIQWQADRNSSKDLGNFLRIHCLLNFRKKRLSSGFHISQV